MACTFSYQMPLERKMSPCCYEKGKLWHTVCVFDEAAKINLQFLQHRARGRRKSLQDVLRCPAVHASPSTCRKWITLTGKPKLVSMSEIKILFTLWSYCYGCGSYFLFIVPFLCKGPIWSSWSQGASWSLGTLNLALNLLTEIWVSAVLLLMVSKIKGERLWARQDKEVR